MYNYYKPFFILCILFFAKFTQAQLLTDVIIPNDVNKVNVVLKGAAGGNTWLRGYEVFSGVTTECNHYGGRGAIVEASFAVGNGVNEIPANSTLRFIKGDKPFPAYRIATLGVGTVGAAGGGGTALLYRAPTSSTWVLLAVAGGGGGSYAAMVAYDCVTGKDGINASQQSFGFSGGSVTILNIPLGANGQGGENGNGGAGGGVNQSASGGGGGAFTNGTSNLICDVSGQSAGGKKGYPNGGLAVDCIDNSSGIGGRGFGAGGAGKNAGGGGGGYSGGGGGEPFFPGGGGGSYVNSFAKITSNRDINPENKDGDFTYSFGYTACAGHNLTSSVGTVTNVSCQGGNNGAAIINYTTTHPARTTFEWFPLTVTGQGTASVTNLAAGTYFCKVKLTNTDGNTCDSMLHTIVITQPNVLTSNVDSVSNAKCNGASNGLVRILVKGGTKPYSANNGTFTTDSTLVISNLAANNYSVIITDAKGCTKTQNYTITQPGVVTNNRVYVNVNATGANSGENWVNAFTDLQSALALSKNCVGVNQIWVAKGTYTTTNNNDRSKSFLVNGNVILYGGFVGNETSLLLRNAGQNNTFLSGNIGNTALNTDNSYHVIVINGANNTAKIDGFIIQDGYNINAPATDTLGAGIYQYNTLTTNNEINIYNCVFRNNSSKMGGAICNDGRASAVFTNATSLIVQNCLFYNNKTLAGNPGSAIANLNNNSIYNDIYLVNSTITQNTDGINNVQVYGSGNTRIYLTNTIVIGTKNFDAVKAVSSTGIYSVNNNITTVNGLPLPASSGINIIDQRPFVNAANPAGNDGKLMTTDDGFALQGCSDAVNAGSNADISAGFLTDFTGNPRKYNNGIVDIGAYELQGTAAAANAVVFVNANAATGGDGATWASAFNNLQDALALATTCLDVKEIWVAAGTYKPTSGTDATLSFSMVNNVKIYGGFAGTEALLTERDWVNNKSILSGEIGVSGLTDNSYHVIKNTNISFAELNGFSIEKGYAFAGGINNQGGGILNTNVTNTKFENIYFTLNRANSGGAIYNLNSPVNINNCIFDANGAFNFGTAGAIYNSSSNVAITNCVFNANTADAGTGAIHNVSSNVDIKFSTFYKNETLVNALVSASGIENNASNLTMINTIMWDTINGANIKNTNGGTANVTYSNIQKNGAAYVGTGNTNVNPIFNDPTNGNGNDNKWFTIDDGLHLRICQSPLLNTGTTVAQPTVPKDIVGANRLQGTAHTMGAYETEILENRNYLSTARLFVKTGSPSTNSGTSWASALSEVGEALRVAHQNPNVKEIWVAAGTYKPIYDEFLNACGSDARNKTFLIPNGVKIYGGFVGSENSLVLANPTANTTILSGDIGVVNNNADNVYHVVSVNDPTLATEINGFEITKGAIEKLASNTDFLGMGVFLWHAYGGGVFVNKGGANFKIDNCKITANQGAINTRGGGLFVYNGSPIITNTTIVSNTANSGGACYLVAASPTFTKVIFSSNTALNIGLGHGFAGAIYAVSDDDIIINKCIFDLNTSVNGGAIYKSGLGTVGITNSIFTENFSSGVGSVISQNNGNIVMTNCTVIPKSTTPFSSFETGTTGLKIVNTIIYYNGNVPPLFNNNTSINFIVKNSNLKTTEIITDSNNINNNPLFINMANPKGADGIWFTADDGLQLPCNSPSVNKGTNDNAPYDDILNNGYLGGIKDMGAYESKDTVPTAPTPTSYQATQTQTGTTHYGDCSGLITSVTSNGAFPIAGPTTAKVWVQFIQPSNYVKRHYEITPANFAIFYSGTITLYFTQQEFGDFNEVNAIKLPTNGTDALGIANLIIEKRSGISNNNTGLPTSYTGTVINIDPLDNNIVWNTSLNRWEITFETQGFSGFYVKTQSSVLAIKWLQVSGNLSGSKQAIINFKVQENNVAVYEIEKSTNGINFSKIQTLNSQGDGINAYNYIENRPLDGVGYYRIKQVDKNGRSQYSTIIKLTNNSKGSFSIYPNPTVDFITITANGGSNQYTLYDLSGKVLQQINTAEQSYILDLTKYSSGLYVLKINNQLTHKIVKQ